MCLERNKENHTPGMVKNKDHDVLRTIDVPQNNKEGARASIGVIVQEEAKVPDLTIAQDATFLKL